jgi:hypothetical protein
VRLTRTGWVVVLGTLLVGLTLTYGLFHLLARVYQRPAVQAPQGIELAPAPLPKPVPSGAAVAGPSPRSIAEEPVPTLAWALRGQPEDLERRLEAVRRYWRIEGALECPDADYHHCRVRVGGSSSASPSGSTALTR